MMARDPGSVWRPLPEAGAPDGYLKTQFIVHSTGTMASAAANWAYFAREAVVVESTFIVGWGPDDPTLQIMDSTDNADANVKANRRGISVEVVGDGIGPYNDWQLSECVRLGLWARAEHGIAPRIIPSEPEGGFGWHVMFGAPGPWTDVRGKVCPGDRRIQQLKDTVFPAIFAGTPLEDDMPLSDDDLNRIAERVLDRKVPRQGGVQGDTSLASTISWLDANLSGLAAHINTGDPVATAAALKDALGNDFARQVVAELGKQLTPA